MSDPALQHNLRGPATTWAVFAADSTPACAYPLASCVCSEKDIGEGDELYDIVGHEEDDEDIYDDLMTVRSRCSVIAVCCILVVTVSRHFLIFYLDKNTRIPRKIIKFFLSLTYLYTM